MVTNEKQRQTELTNNYVSSKPIKVRLTRKRALLKILAYRPTLRGRASIKCQDLLCIRIGIAGCCVVYVDRKQLTVLQDN